jgi:glycosyltransferase involved in cell wall biosynthesis
MMPGETPDITFVILTRNEAAVIGRCIASVAGLAREIIVCDSGSTDGTCSLAEGLGARVVEHPWEGDFARQRNIGDRHAGSGWIFHLDADETLSPALAGELRDFFATGRDAAFAGGKFPRKELIFGKYIAHGGWYPQYKLRLYRNGSGSWSGPVHERLDLTGEVHAFAGDILHDSYRDVQTFIDKFNRYSSIDAAQEYARGRRFSLLKLLFTPPERFFGRYVVHGGYRDGAHGFVLALLIGLNYFIRYLKLWELGYRGKRTP